MSHMKGMGYKKFMVSDDVDLLFDHVHRDVFKHG